MESQSSGTLSTHTDTSKTESNKSGTIKEIDRDYTKDNSASPIDLECNIQQERITKIFDELIYKVKLSICLPHLVNEYHTLKKTLSPPHLDDLMFIFEQYDSPLFSSSLENLEALEDIRGGDLSLKNRLNPELGHLLYILNSYSSLRPKIEDLIEQMKSNYTSKVSKPDPGLEFLLELERFFFYLLRQMENTAADELSKKLKTRKKETNNTKLKNKIQEYTETLEAEQKVFEKTLKVKAELIEKLQQELNFLQNQCNVKLKKKILDSDRQMVLLTRTHDVKFQMLTDEEVELRESYETILARHLADEKNQRARRFKVETQLLSWVQKYDTEMSDKQAELEDFVQKYEDESQRCEDLEAKLAEQDNEFIPLMAEKEEEYHQEMTNKMNAFKIDHAARVIQNAWKEALANRAEKKRLRKLKKAMEKGRKK